MIASLLTLVCLSQTAPPAAVQALPFNPAAIAARPRVTVRVNEDGKPVAYEGVPLASLLPGDLDASKGQRPMAAVKELSDAVILVRGSDGYQVAVSAAAVAMDPSGERYLLAVARDGKPLDERHGPIELVIPGDPKRVRWCHGIAGARLVRVGALAGSP